WHSSRPSRRSSACGWRRRPSPSSPSWGSTWPSAPADGASRLSGPRRAKRSRRPAMPAAP
ncbi:MAG: hypothetical protein AVDCRST_MAG38-379, partial [uncultured Solirubrobacteraceae bacterium]